jgi:type VI protein secretion system component VasK
VGDAESPNALLGGVVMLIAADYPFLDILWSMIIFFCWVAWIWMLIVIFGDLFSRHDVGGWAKAAWVVFMIVLPFIGVLCYLITNSRSMAERRMKSAQDAQAQFDSYVKTVAADGGGAAAQISQAKELLDSGAITQAEFDSLKAKALA